MEDVLGGRTDRRRFDRFLADWEAILARRVDEAVAAFATVDGVAGLVLAGGVGRGAAWPLSDIDLLPVYDDARAGHAAAEIERRRVALLPRWVAEGWWTGLDIGKLAFTAFEVAAAIAADAPASTALLDDDRWYYSIDKAYQGRAVYDPSGLAAPLARWLTAQRFSSPVVRLRLDRARREVEQARHRSRVSLEHRAARGVTIAVRTAVMWLQAWQLERWGERDASLARVGTRFEVLARERGRPELAAALNELSCLDDASVERRMAAAPGWVWERHDRSWRARRHVGEPVTRRQDARDVLRVCGHYALRRQPASPYPAWLAIPVDAGRLAAIAERLSAVASCWFLDDP